jgi:hypothetical protein
MLEAMGHGVVPVVSRVESGVRDVISEGKTGYSFPIGDIDMCADLIASLDRNRALLAEMSGSAWSLVRDRYSVESHARQLAQLLDRCIEQPAEMAQVGHMGYTARSYARLVPSWAIVSARKLLKKGDPMNEGFVTFP